MAWAVLICNSRCLAIPRLRISYRPTFHNYNYKLVFGFGANKKLFIMKRLNLFLGAFLLSIFVNATVCDNLTLTSDSYSDSEDLITAIHGELGSNYTIADWNDLKALSDIDAWISCMDLAENASFMVTRNGEYLYSGNRQYFVRHYPDGNVPGGWLVHDQIGNKLFLGSWYDINCKILAKQTCSSVECSTLKLTCDTYSDTDNLIGAIQSELGTNYTIADWNNLKALPDINAWISCMNLEDNASFMVTRNGEYLYSGNRQYFVRHYPDGNVPGGWLVHDQIGNKLFLGSWYDINCKILALNTSASSVIGLSLKKNTIYPNPAKDLLFIDSQENLNGRIEIYNSLGQIVFTEKLFNNLVIDLSTYVKGFYFVAIKDDVGKIIFSEKILKE
jgi:hypothetical protein